MTLNEAFETVRDRPAGDDGDPSERWCLVAMDSPAVMSIVEITLTRLGVTPADDGDNDANIANCLWGILAAFEAGRVHGAAMR